jgi:hypothetical protein
MACILMGYAMDGFVLLLHNTVLIGFAANRAEETQERRI